jgi:hypothetical protein
MVGGREEFTPRERAEDILLGGLGYGEGAQILEVEVTQVGYRGIGVWPDGERFDFESYEGVSELERWALGVVSGGG